MSRKVISSIVLTVLLVGVVNLTAQEKKDTIVSKLPYTIVDTGQVRCYSDRMEIKYPKTGDAFFGQDAQYNGNQPAYRDNGDGTVTDLNTGLMWTQNPGAKKIFSQATSGASKCKDGGYNDWRLPTIKELYSLILFSGTDPDPRSVSSSRQNPFIDTKYFKFQYGQAADGERVIDSQYATCTKYVSTTMHGNETMFGVNFADGRIKGYPIGRTRGRKEKKYYVMYVRGNSGYGKNDFKDNSDGTVTDRATGLMWMRVDSGHLKAGINKDGKLNWQQALEWAENLEYAGCSDWRLPNTKELHSIVDYSRCPDVTNSAAIDPVFEVTPITNQGGKLDYPYYWTSTSHAKLSQATSAVYTAFGRALGLMQDRGTGTKQLLDVHGAGAQRADAKSGDPSRLPESRGPQGDVLRTYNYVRCVRRSVAEPRTTGPKLEMVYSAHRPQDNRRRTRPQDRAMGLGRGGNTKMPQRPSGTDFIQRLDTNGDGKVSKSEFDGPARHFSHLDRNNDGWLSAEEAPQGPPQERNGRGGEESLRPRR